MSGSLTSPLWNLTCPVLSYWVCVPAWLVFRQDYWTCAYPCVNALYMSDNCPKGEREFALSPFYSSVFDCTSHPSFLFFISSLLPVFFLTHILFLLKTFLSFVTTLLLFECFFGDWWRVEMLAIFPTSNLKISSSLVVSLYHMSFFAASNYSSSFCPFECNCPRQCQINPLLFSRWRLVCVIFDWSTQIIFTGFLYSKVAPYLHYTFQCL